MSVGEIAVHILPAYRRRLSRRWLRSVAQRVLEQEGIAEPVEVSVVIADDETLRRLNHDYRGLDEVTDVLAFALQSTARQGDGTPLDEDGMFVTPPQQPVPLGDVVVSYPQAVRQARQHRCRVRQEVALLVAHGVLHLLGYEHAEPEEERIMWRKQEAVVAASLAEVAS